MRNLLSERNGWADEVGPHRHTFRVITHGINPPLLFVNVFLFFLSFTNYDISNYYVYMSVVLGSLRFSYGSLIFFLFGPAHDHQNQPKRDVMSVVCKR